jgi:MFS transporter, DHA2 family, multidrug resistance protein
MADATTAGAGGAAVPVDPAEERIDPKRLLAFTFMVFGMFMSILDIQIVSASLSEIQAGLSASSEEISWIQTAYLIAEVIAIPFSGYMSRALGTRNLFAISAAGFTVASLLCGLSQSIGQLIFWRAIQGFIGAGMIPTVFASAYSAFPRSKFHIVGPVIGLVATLAPTIGPTVGGQLTDALSWHWLFFINIVPGIVVTAAALILIDFDQPEYGLLNRLDWWGLASMAGFLGSLEYVLEEGPRHEWFEDNSIVAFTIVMSVSAVVFFYRVFTVAEPIVDLRAFKDRNFALGCWFQFCAGIGLYGLTYLYPIFLAQVRGYNALMIGNTLFVTGVTQFLFSPILGQLLRRVDLRVLIFVGLMLFALGTWQMTFITRDFDFWELFVPQMLRAFGMMLAMVPANNIALGTLPPHLIKNASGLFNLNRNLGGAVGLAVINTVLNQRIDFHIARLHEAVTWGNMTAVETLNNLAQKFNGTADAQLKALKQLTMIVHRQAVVMSFGDVFWMLTVGYVFLGCLVFFVKKVDIMQQPQPGRR